MQTVCALQEVSRHRTGEGLAGFDRCRCGRSDVRRRDVAATAGVVVVAVLVVVLVLVAAIAVPLAALVVGVGLGLFVGGLAGVGAGFVAADPYRGVRVAVSTGAAAVLVVVTGEGLVAALGPVSVIALPVLYAMAGLVWWVGPRRRSTS